MKHDFVLRSLCVFAAVLFVLCTGFLPQRLLFAQEASAVHSLQQGSCALQYGVGSNFNLGSLLGSTISFKKHISDSHAWQVGLGVRADFSSGEYVDADRNYIQQSFAVIAHYLVYPLLTERSGETIHFFYGAGPEITWNRSTESIDREQNDRDVSENRWSIGVSGVVGTEWFVHERISLSASYRSVLGFRRESTDIEGENVEDAGSRNGLSLSSHGVLFGVSVYF